MLESSGHMLHYLDNWKKSGMREKAGQVQRSQQRKNQNCLFEVDVHFDDSDQSDESTIRQYGLLCHIFDITVY